MNEILAVDKRSCPACGAQAEWSPSRQALVCTYCGTVAPHEFDRDSGSIREIDLVTTLRNVPDELRGWLSETRSVKCRSCQAISVFQAARVGQNCEFCGSPEIVDYEEIRAPIRPQSVLPFRVDTAKVREALRLWFAGKWLAPRKLRSRALVDTVHGVYLPYWTFDARVHCPWTADSGTYYYTTQTYRDSSGQRKTRRVRHVRWRRAAGQVDHFFDDEPIPGTRGVELDLLRGVEPFPTSALVPYDTGYLAGFVIEHYQVVLIDAARASRESMERQLTAMCAARVPGDTYKNLRIRPSYGNETFKHMLVPVWLLTYDYGRKRYQVVVNGSTGTLAGRYPKSKWKIFFLVLLALAAIAGILLTAGPQIR